MKELFFARLKPNFFEDTPCLSDEARETLRSVGHYFIASTRDFFDPNGDYDPVNNTFINHQYIYIPDFLTLERGSDIAPVAMRQISVLYALQNSAIPFTCEPSDIEMSCAMSLPDSVAELVYVDVADYGTMPINTYLARFERLREFFIELVSSFEEVSNK